jgi:hypothetical protein
MFPSEARETRGKNCGNLCMTRTGVKATLTLMFEKQEYKTAALIAESVLLKKPCVEVHNAGR